MALRCYVTISGKKKIYKIIIDFMVYFDHKYVTIWRCSIPPQLNLLKNRTTVNINSKLLSLIIHAGYEGSDHCKKK